MEGELIFALSLVALLSFSAVECGPSHKVSYKMPAQCHGQTYCEYRGDDYPPENYIVDILKENNLYWSLSRNINYSHRQGFSTNSECREIDKHTEIYYVLDKNNVTRIVVQSLHPTYHYRQKYDIRKCVKEGPTSSTKNIMRTDLENPIFNFNLYCVNQASEFDFQVLTNTVPAQLESIQVKIPVSCGCRYDVVPKNL